MRFVREADRKVGAQVVCARPRLGAAGEDAGDLRWIGTNDASHVDRAQAIAGEEPPSAPSKPLRRIATGALDRRLGAIVAK